LAIRTDLVGEARENYGSGEGIDFEVISFGSVKIERTKIKNNIGAKNLQKPIGDYVTISFSGFTPEDVEGELHSAIKTELTNLLGDRNLVLVAGLGNEHITPDAFGTFAAEGVFATRHIENTMSRELGLGNLRSVEVITPGVLGETGIEAAELIAAAVSKTRPDTVIVLDALAAGDLKRVGTTIQLSNSGICPGSGVGNSRKEISEATVGVPVIAIGIPTVVDASSFMERESGEESPNALSRKMMVTPRDIDTMVRHAAKAVSHAINCALQPDIDKNILLSLGF